MEEILVKREDTTYGWVDLKPKIIGVLIEIYSDTRPRHDAKYDQDISVKWDKVRLHIKSRFRKKTTPLPPTFFACSISKFRFNLKVHAKKGKNAFSIWKFIQKRKK